MKGKGAVKDSLAWHVSQVKQTTDESNFQSEIGDVLCCPICKRKENVVFFSPNSTFSYLGNWMKGSNVARNLRRHRQNGMQYDFSSLLHSRLSLERFQMLHNVPNDDLERISRNGTAIIKAIKGATTFSGNCPPA